MVGELHLPFINKLRNWCFTSSFLAAAAYDSQMQFIHETMVTRRLAIPG